MFTFINYFRVKLLEYKIEKVIKKINEINPNKPGIEKGIKSKDPKYLSLKRKLDLLFLRKISIESSQGVNLYF